MAFIPDFTFDGELDNAEVNSKVQFTAASIADTGTGIVPDRLIDDSQFQVVSDSNVTIDDVINVDSNGNKTFKDDYDFVNIITKYEWQTSDGFFFSGPEVMHIFKDSGIFQVTLSIFSEKFALDDGRTFQYKHSIVKDIRIFSQFFRLITQNLPLWNRTENVEMEDFIFGVSEFFNRIYKDTKRVFNNIDVENIEPGLLEYLAATLGQDGNYVKKVGSNIDDDSFQDYDIFERIKNNLATDDEIEIFRQFILYSAQLFKDKGTEDNIRSLLTFYNIIANIDELWTSNWGQTSIGMIGDEFNGLSDFEDNNIGLRWLNLRVVGNNNDEGHFEKRFNTIIIDNYHESQKLAYDEDVVSELEGGQKDGWEEFEILHNPVNIRDIRLENGNEFAERDSVEFYDIEPNDPVRFQGSPYDYVLQINPEVVDVGDRISVLYETAKEEIVDSLVATSEMKARSFDARLTFKFNSIAQTYKENNIRTPENEVFLLFRGIKDDDTDIYSTFNQYYRVSLNTKRSTFDISRVVESQKNKQLITQQINLSGDRDNPIYQSLILNDDEDDKYDFKDDTQYEFMVQVMGDHISLFFRENTVDQEITKNIASDIGGNEYGKENDEWICLVQNLNINVDQSQVISLDQSGDEVISQKYNVIDEKGHFGFGIRSGILEVIDFHINILDVDDTLLTDFEKEIFHKPKYLDWQSRDLLRYNSYDGNANQFSQDIASPFDKDQLSYNTNNDTLSSALSFLYFDNATLDEEVASRYTITFDEDWVNDNFDSEEEVAEKIIIPFGSQYIPFFPEMRVQNQNHYKNINGLTAGSTANPDAPAPGLFNYNLSTILGSYHTQPHDEFSTLTRDDEGFGLNFELNNRIKDYKISNQSFFISGIFEEVAPRSADFSEGTQLSDGTTFKNNVLFPIISSGTNFSRTLGVRFRHCRDIETIIERGRAEGVNEVQLYGSFAFHLPPASVEFRPDLMHELEPSPFVDGYFLGRAFVPLGVLNTEIQNYSLGVEFMHEVSNSGFADIYLEGVYYNYPSQKISVIDNILTMDSVNPFENKARGLACKTFLNASLDLATGLEDWEVPSSSDVISNKYLMNLNVRKMFKQLEKQENYDQSRFEDDDGNEFTDQEKLDLVFDNWSWWRPDEVWRKRDFKRIKLNYDEDVSTGINLGDEQRAFFGKSFNASTIKKVKHQTFKLTDGEVTPNTIYYAKIIVRMNWSGYNENNLSQNRTGRFVDDRPLTEQEAANVTVRGGASKNKYEKHSMAPTGKCLEYYVPISWYGESDLPDDQNIEWANYIRGSSGTGVPTVTMTPYGLMTWMFQHATGDIDTAELMENFKQVTSGWTLRDWNERFWQLVNVEFIAEKVPSDKYNLMSEYGFVTRYASEPGVYLELDYDAGNIDWYVSKKLNLVPSGFGGYYFEIPTNVQDFRRWIENVRSIKAFNFTVPKSLYTFLRKDAIQLIDDVLFDVFDGGDLKARLFSDIFFDSDRFKTFLDNFNDERNIPWTTYENTEGDKFELAVRTPSTSIAFGTGEDGNVDPSFEIIERNGINVFKRDEDETLGKFDPLKLGSNKADMSKVQIDQNGGFKKSIYIVDNKNEAFEFTTHVLFDEQLDTFKGYNGKHFEHIIKANIEFNPNKEKYQIESYYFVGIGTFGFDIALGVAKYNFLTDEVEKTFLAGFGDFNTKNIKVETWYKLKTIVENNYIRVIFNESEEEDRLVINYNIDPLRQDDPDRYIEGAFEELVYLVTGLDSLDITYPNKVLSKTNRTFFDENWDMDLAKNLRPQGSLSGMRVFNNLTYVNEAEYKARIQDSRLYGGSYEVTDQTDVIAQSRNRYNATGDVKFIGKTLNGTIVLQVGNSLFYKLRMRDVQKFSDDVIKTEVFQNKIVIRFKESKAKLAIIDGDLLKTQNVFVKDSSFNTDYIFKYLTFTERQIENFWLSQDNIYVEFTELE